MSVPQDQTESQPVYSLEELTQASIDLLRAVEASAALQDQLTNRVLQIERYLAEAPAPSEATDQPTQIVPTGPQLQYRDSHESFIAALADIEAQSEPRDLRAIEALADMTAAAMRQADRAYYDLQEHNASPVSARHAATHGIAGDTGVESTVGEPEIRVRIAHTHTIKEGWRCNETTAEWTGRGLKPARSFLVAAMQMAFDEGRDEADRRNHPDAEPEFEAIAAVAS